MLELTPDVDRRALRPLPRGIVLILLRVATRVASNEAPSLVEGQARVHQEGDSRTLVIVMIMLMLMLLLLLLMLM